MFVRKKLLWEGEILIIVHFRGGFGLLSTRGRPAGDPRKTPEGIEEREILIIGHFFWGGVFGEVRLNQ